jgi:hypothetical protein
VTSAVVLSTQSTLPAVTGEVSPGIFRKELALVLIVTSDDDGGLNVEAPFAVNPPVTVNDPLFVVAVEAWPMLTAAVLVVPILIVPLVVAPAPALMLTLPPVLVPPVPVALPAVRLSEPPVEVVFPD